MARRAEGRRLLVPLTVHWGRQITLESAKVEVGGWGAMLLVSRQGGAYAAEFVCSVGFYPCVGGQAPKEEERLRATLAGGGQETVSSLKRHPEGTGRKLLARRRRLWWLSVQAPLRT